MLSVVAGSFAALHAQSSQQIHGVITDDVTGTPLIGAVVRIVDVPSLGATTDADGKFEIKSVPIGRHSFRVSYTGYEERLMPDVVVTAGKEVTLNVPLQEAVRKLNDVTIVYNKSKDKTRTNNDMAQVSARSFNVDETRRYAGSLGDPSRMAANFAGVVSGNDSRNDIVVRGNSPAGMLWQMEGLNIPNPNHYGSLGTTGGPVSMLNSNNIDKSDFLASAYPAQYGNALSGVFDLKLRDGNFDKHEYLAQVGFNGFEFGAEGPLGQKKNTSFLVNYRYSTLGVFQKLGMDFGSGSAVPIYQDVNFKVKSKLSKATTLTLFGFAGNSKIDFLGKDVDTNNVGLYGGDPYADERNKFGTSVTGLSLDHRFGERTTAKVTLGYSTTMQRYKSDSLSTYDYHSVPNAYGRFATGKMSLVSQLAHKFNARNTLVSGFTWDQTSFDLVNKNIHPDGSEEVFVNKTGTYGLGQAYSTWKHRYSEKLSSVAGVHGQYLTLNNGWAVEPRLSIRYALGPTQSISAGYGIHNQAQNIYTYYSETTTPNGVLYTNKQLNFTRSHQSALTYDWNINEHLRLKAEAYYQYIDKAPVEQRLTSFSSLNTGADFGFTDVDSLVNKGSGRNYGMELTLEHFFYKGYYFLITGSLFDSKYRGSDGILRNTAFNTHYVCNVLGGKEFKVGRRGNVLALNLRMTTVGGRYFTPVDITASQAERQNVFLDAQAYSQKQPAYFRTDFRVSFRKEYNRSTLEMAIDFQNLTNHKNIYERYYDVDKGKIVTTYQQNFFPVPTIRYTF